ncbi:isocitrate lyase/phosphoenolpyruvate mutase family protein [Streptomyces sp. AV19]|uniref:isocitrate lyase/PEP mutase family protein n=1 Tax=Streptomyces sp. AV19 TaxID=2793068 RepID=UPI0018FE3F9B|nr:isocitrate lyase/phosphoenolpyruvate mutase family protein [Streptomyces sp. AV19]MBH1935937.1 isocitrate lyase/phosphoenolpyruvate mutase family protein [Streptomyces sp. AV19]MDG4534279.1 isocitrate lyase/phosphoenolpyruvate mutase family protein [Streptomyces sp. AV19]
MTDFTATLRALHHGRLPDDPLILPGPWDAGTARVLADAGFPALATPSAGIAMSLGVADGEVPADEMFAAVARIARAVPVPVSADLEDGYGLPPAELVERILESGAVGCNLEDTDRRTGRLVDPHEQADRLAAVRAAAGDALFVNARVDSYLRDAPEGDAQERARLYAAAGADCVFPIFAPPERLAEIAEASGLPVNALCRGGECVPAELGELGATRITFGPWLYKRTMAGLGDLPAVLRPA